jgi:outer membrane protein assembly factor BamD
MKLHPASPAMDYALYLKGVINFNDDLGMFAFLTRQDLSERDQKAAKESFESFKDLVTRFPDSRYAPDARQRMNYIVNSLAQYEVHVARYYYSRGAYLAAINRAQIALADYREVPALEEALYIMVKSYDALGMKDLRDDAQRVLTTNYPKSTYLANGFRARTTLGGSSGKPISGTRGGASGAQFLSASSAASKSDSFSSRRIGGRAASSRRP